MVIMVERANRLATATIGFQAGTADEQYIQPAVPIVIDTGAATPDGLDDIVLARGPLLIDEIGEPAGGGYVRELRARLVGKSGEQHRGYREHTGPANPAYG